MDFKVPSALLLSGNVSKNWRLWEQQFQNFHCFRSKQKARLGETYHASHMHWPMHLPQDVQQFPVCCMRRKIRIHVMLCWRNLMLIPVIKKGLCSPDTYILIPLKRASDAKFEDYHAQLQTLAKLTQWVQREGGYDWEQIILSMNNLTTRKLTHPC